MSNTILTNETVVLVQNNSDGVQVDTFTSLKELVEHYLTGTHVHPLDPQKQVAWLKSLHEKIEKSVVNIKQDWSC